MLRGTAADAVHTANISVCIALLWLRNMQVRAVPARSGPPSVRAQVGASSFMWRQQHVVGHHAYTNLAGSDPDICSAADPDLRCIAPAQAPQPHHVRRQCRPRTEHHDILTHSGRATSQVA